MRYFLISIITCLSFASHAQSIKYTMSEAMKNYRSACLTMLDAIEKKDRYILYDAQDLFSLNDIIPLSDNDISLDDVTLAQYEMKPTILFNREYTDSLLAHNFSPIDIDDIHENRKGDGSIYTYHKAIAPQGTLSYSVTGYDDCELMVLTDSGKKLDVTLTDNNANTYTSDVQNNGQISFISWKMESLGKYVFTIKNPLENPVSFVIAIR